MINKNVFLVFLILVGLTMLSGCANLKPVSAFADETKKLSAAFDPMLSGSVETCTEKYIWKKFLTSRIFDPTVAENKAKELCGPIDDDNKIIADFNSLLEQYADTLAALADDKLPSYKAELDGLKTSLGKIKKQASQDALINSDKLEVVNSLAEFLSRIATQHLQNSAIRELLGHKEAINIITNALNDYAKLNYKAWLNDQQSEIVSLRKSLNDFATNEPLAANYVRTLLLTEEKKIVARNKTIDAFSKSVTELQKTNAELVDKFDDMDNKALLDQLLSLAKEVSGLRKQVKNAF